MLRYPAVRLFFIFLTEKLLESLCCVLIRLLCQICMEGLHQQQASYSNFFFFCQLHIFAASCSITPCSPASSFWLHVSGTVPSSLALCSCALARSAAILCSLSSSLEMSALLSFLCVSVCSSVALPSGVSVPGGGVRQTVFLGEVCELSTDFLCIPDGRGRECE